MIIDDEADFASLTFRRRSGAISLGVISKQIDEARALMKTADFLQVTATPYSLYLQPEEEVVSGGVMLFRPKRPTFTKILPLHIYQILQKIHEFDSALRESFESGAHERGVYFIHRDNADRLRPCSPSKLMLSRLTSIRPGRRLLPVGFQTVAKLNGGPKLKQLDEGIRTICGPKMEGVVEIQLDIAIKLLELAYANLEFDENEAEDERSGHIAALEHLSKMANDPKVRGKVLLITAVDRDVARKRDEGRFSNAPDTKQQADDARKRAKSIPVLMLLRQKGGTDKGWRDLPFWWPVIVVPQDAPTSVYADEIAADEPVAESASADATAISPSAPGSKSAEG